MFVSFKQGHLIQVQMHWWSPGKYVVDFVLSAALPITSSSSLSSSLMSDIIGLGTATPPAFIGLKSWSVCMAVTIHIVCQHDKLLVWAEFLYQSLNFFYLNWLMLIISLPVDTWLTSGAIRVLASLQVGGILTWISTLFFFIFSDVLACLHVSFRSPCTTCAWFI